MIKTNPVWLVFLLATAFLPFFQIANATSVGSDTAAVTATVSGGYAGEQVDAYDTTPGAPLTVDFATIDSSVGDYHLSQDANLQWAALPGSWELTVYYDGAVNQIKGTSASNLGAPLNVAIGFELDDAAAAADPPADGNFSDDSDATYKIIRLYSVLKQVLADGTSVFVGGPNDGERKFGDIGSRPFVLVVSTKGGVIDGDYSGTLTFDLDNGL